MRDTVARENIVGSPDMTPDKIRGPMEEAGLSGVSVPTCAVAGKKIETGADAKCFAEQVALFSIVMGVALLLTGIGFLVLTFGLARRLDHARERAAT